MKLSFAPLVACVLVACLVSSSSATIPLPVAWWTFNNDENQVMGTYDGVIPDQGPRGIDLGNTERNGTGGQPWFFFSSTIDDTLSGRIPGSGIPIPDGSGIAPEHYVNSGARFTGADKAYHMEGSTSRTYEDPNDPTFPNFAGPVDPQSDNVLATFPDQWSWRDRLETEPDEEAGGLFGGSLVTYAFWMQFLSVPDNDQDRVMFISQESSTPSIPNSWGGDVQVVNIGGFNTDKWFQFNNSGAVQTVDVKFKRNEWHHYVVEYDLTGAEGVVTVWQDGGLLNVTPDVLDNPNKEVLGGMGTEPINGPFKLNNSAHPEGIGQQFAGNFGVDDLAIWTGVHLTDQDAFDLYSQGITPLLPAFGVISPADTDKDFDVDTADLTTMFQNFTGAVGAAGGKTTFDGDTELDGDVDTADLTLGFQEFTGALDGLANNPDLIYDPATGNVKIDADGANMLVFNLQSAAQFLPPADFSDLDTDVGFVSAFVDNTASAIGWTSALALANIGFDGPAGSVNTPLADLGNVLPTGLDLAGLTALLSNKAWGGPSGAGGDFDFVVIPEPSSLMLLGLGLVGLICLCLRKTSA